MQSVWPRWGLTLAVLGVAVSADAEDLAERLRTRLEVRPSLETAAGDPLLAVQTLHELYTRRVFRPLWSDGEKPLPLARRLLRVLRQSDQDGLSPENYHVTAIDTLLRDIETSRVRGNGTGYLTDLDLLLTDAFLLYASHLMEGRVDPTTFDNEWHVPPALRADVLGALEVAARGGEIERTLAGLRPPQSGYARLRRALAKYRKMASRTPWREVPAGPKLAVGVDDPRVPTLRDRLVRSGDLAARAGSADGTSFGRELEAAVTRFQRRHGLEPDGAVGPATLAALNVTAQERVRQIELNLERWRWLPDDLGARRILVNIPSFELELVEDGDTVMEMRVVVGGPYRRTPVFSSSMTYLVLSPYWHVPPSMAVQDILPAVQKDPDYLVARKIRVFQGWGADAEAIDPATIDWSQVQRSSFPYRFRQDPGPLNALGVVKFMFPNLHNVYLHDSPARELFARPDRTFSSGCIRIEHPIDLAEHLLRTDSSWTRERILAAVERGEETTVRLPDPVEVHLQYWTSWVDSDGTVQFRKDVYGRDELLAQALATPAPAASPVDVAQ